MIICNEIPWFNSIKYGWVDVWNCMLDHILYEYLLNSRLFQITVYSLYDFSSSVTRPLFLGSHFFWFAKHWHIVLVYEISRFCLCVNLIADLLALNFSLTCRLIASVCTPITSRNKMLNPIRYNILIPYITHFTITYIMAIDISYMLF